LRRAEAFHQPTRAFYFLRCDSHRLQGRAAAAEEDAKRYKAMAGITAWDYFLPGRTAAWGGDLEEAERNYRAALRVQPNHFPSLFFLAGHVMRGAKVKRLPEAIQVYTACLAARPNEISLYGFRAGCLMELGQLDEAEADCSAAIAAATDEGDRILAFEQRYEFYQAVGRTEKARQDQARMIQLAEQWREKKAKATPDADTLANMINLAATYATLGRHAEALQLKEVTLGLCKTKLGPDHPHTLASMNNLAWFLATAPDAKLRDPTRALRLAKAVVQQTPKNGGHWNTLGVACYRAGDWNQAIEALEKSEALSPGQYVADNGFFLAMAHWQRGSQADARQWYERAVQWMEKNNPKDAELRRFSEEASKLLGVSESQAEKKRP
jgi:tetratricopeptide (TPR) repeat protein